MDKQEILNAVRSAASQKIISREEVVVAYDEGAGVKQDFGLKKLGIAEILYYIGGAVVFLGISILVWQNWDALGFPGKLAATLGASVAAYVVGLLFSKEEKFEAVGAAFYLISALVMPIGLYVVFNNAGFDTGSAGVQSFMALICLIVFAASYFGFKKNIFALFSIIFGTWFYFAVTSFLIGNDPIFDWRFFAYRVLAAGLSYVCLGYGFSKGSKASLSGFLYGFGILGFLGAALSLQGWSPDQSIFWEMLFPFLVFGTLFVSVHLKSKSFLTFGSLFLMVYILKITQEYFTNDLGWSMALVLAGLMLIAVGYLYVYLKKKYISA